MYNGTKSTNENKKIEMDNKRYDFFLSNFHQGSFASCLSSLQALSCATVDLGRVNPIMLISGPIAATHHNAFRQPSSSIRMGSTNEKNISPVMAPVDPIPVAMDTCFTNNSGIDAMAGAYTNEPLIPMRTP